MLHLGCCSSPRSASDQNLHDFSSGEGNSNSLNTRTMKKDICKNIDEYYPKKGEKIVKLIHDITQKLPAEIPELFTCSRKLNVFDVVLNSTHYFPIMVSLIGTTT